MQSAPAIAFDYVPSRRVTVALAGMWALALCALLISDIGALQKVLLAIAASVHVFYAVRRHLSQPARRVAWYEAGFWQVRDREGAEFQATLRDSSIIGDLLVLRLRSTRAGNLSLILLSDNCAAELRRKLRVRLARKAGAVDAAR